MKKEALNSYSTRNKADILHKLLVVEDDAALLHLIQKKLRFSGFLTDGALSGADGIARAIGNHPELLILDYRLPDMTCKQVIESLAAEKCEVPFVVITGHGDEKVAVELMKLGAKDYLIKDTAFLDLLPSVVRQVFEQLGLEEQLASAEEALKESEEKLRSYLESSPDGIYVHDVKGLFLYVNSAAEKLMGYSRDELVGRRLQELNVISPEYWSRARTLQEFNTFGRPAGPVEIKLLRRDGSNVLIEVSTYPIVRGEKIEVISIARDITERKRMEEALRESEERFRRLVQDMNDGYIVVQGLKVVFANARVADMFGYELDEVIGKPVGGLLASEVIGNLDELHARRLRGESVPQQYEITLPRKDGILRTVEFSARLIDYAGAPAVSIVIRDVTERKRVECVLRQSEHNFRVLFESTLDGLLVIDGETLKVVFGNKVAARIFGFDSVEEAIGTDPLDFIPPEDRERVLKIIVEDGLEKDLHEVHEFRAVTTDGREIWISTVGTRTEYQGRLANLVSVRDITEQKKSEEEKQRLEQQLNLASRLAAVGELAAGVAHELNNPLAAIQGYAQFLASRNDLDEKVKKDVGIVYREAQRASRITQNLLSFARKHELEKCLISINDAVVKTLELCAHQMKVNNIELEEELASDLPKTMADFHQMQQVFMNIIVNAEQAMVSAHGQGKLVVRTQKVNGMIRVTFADDGPGIAEENLKRIFDPFFTTKDVGKGTGLGLSICYGIVQAHGGHIYAKSKPGKGASFIVEIPVVSGDKA